MMKGIKSMLKVESFMRNSIYINELQSGGKNNSFQMSEVGHVNIMNEF